MEPDCLKPIGISYSRALQFSGPKGFSFAVRNFRGHKYIIFLLGSGFEKILSDAEFLNRTPCIQIRVGAGTPNYLLSLNDNRYINHNLHLTSMQTICSMWASALWQWVSQSDVMAMAIFANVRYKSFTRGCCRFTDYCLEAKKTQKNHIHTQIRGCKLILPFIVAEKQAI